MQVLQTLLIKSLPPLLTKDFSLALRDSIMSLVIVLLSLISLKYNPVDSIFLVTHFYEGSLHYEILGSRELLGSG